MGSRRHFTSDEFDRIKHFYLDELRTTDDISTYFDVSRVTIRTLLIKMGVPLRRTWANKTKICPECHRELPRSAFYNKDHVCKKCRPSYQRKTGSAMKYKYGITRKQFDFMLKAQDYKCAICGKEITDQEPHIDHDHNTGKVRGLLCGKCNTALGLFGDDPSLLNKAVQYLTTIIL